MKKIARDQLSTDEGEKSLWRLRVTTLSQGMGIRLPDLDDAVVGWLLHAITRMQETMPGIKE